MPATVASAPRSPFRALLAQAAKFGAVGAVGLVVDVGIFNLLRVTVLSPEILHEGPLVAKVVSTTLAIFTNWMGNRYWTFAGLRQRSTLREGIEFFAVSVGGMLIGVGCLWISHYVLGFTSVLADNVASNVVGLGLGALFRFLLYRYWVFSPHRPHRSTGGAPTAGGATDGTRGDVGGGTEETILPAGRG